jgi:hypothetical protein
VRDAESLVSMLDDAASLLDQLGAAGTALAPQMLSAWKDTVTSRRTMLGLTPVAAHVRMVTAALSRDNTASERRRLLRNLATVATLAGRLAYEDLGDALSGRAYYSMAADSAREADDDQAAAIVLGYAAQLAHSEGMTGAAVDHLVAALAHAERAPAVAPWLASIQATIRADSGDHTSADDALQRAEPTTHQPVTQPHLLLVDYGPAHLAAATGHACLQAGTTPQPELRWLARSTNFRPPPVGLAFSCLLISQQRSRMRATSPTRAATPLPPLTYSSGAATPQAPLACAHSALPQLDQSARAPCAFSTNTSPNSPPDESKRSDLGPCPRPRARLWLGRVRGCGIPSTSLRLASTGGGSAADLPAQRFATFLHRRTSQRECRDRVCPPPTERAVEHQADEYDR